MNLRKARRAARSGWDDAFAVLFVPARTATRNDLVGAHGNVIRYFVMKALKADTRSWVGMSVAHASITSSGSARTGR